MSYKVQAAVVRAKDAPVTIETIIVPKPGPGEVVVDVSTCGVCHTDYLYVEGGVGDNYPYLLGHESTAVVSEVGEGGTNVAVVDKVMLNWRAVCGECRACEIDRKSTRRNSSHVATSDAVYSVQQSE